MGMGADNFVDWRVKGPCSNLSPGEYDKMFFPKKGRSINDAKRFCNDCPVIDECFEWAMEHREHGIWGGTSSAEREGIRRFRARLNSTVLVTRKKKRIVSRGPVVLT